MSQRTEDLLTYRTLHDGPVVSVSEYCCRACRSGPAAEEYSDANNIVLMRLGAFSKHFGRKSVTADVNQAAFFSKGSTYRVSHPADCGDRGTILRPSSRVLNDIIRELDPSIDDGPEQPFPFVTGPCAPHVFWRHRELVHRLEVADVSPLEPLWADVTALQVVADVLEAAYSRHKPRPKRRRSGTATDHAERTEAVKSYLAGRLADPVTLTDLAEAVHSSPFHLARIFQQQTGVPIHRYLTHLRLRASLERLAEGADDLTTLALELGFSSHSHFTDTFRREFGRSPSEVRLELSRRRLRELSKNLEV